MATPEGFVAVVLPVSGKTVDVEIKEEGLEAERLTWEPESALFVDTGKAFSLVEGSSHFVYVLVGVEAPKQWRIRQLLYQNEKEIKKKKKMADK